MKRIYLLALVCIGFISFYSCSNEQLVEDQNSARQLFDFSKSDVDCGEPAVYDLIAGQHINVGSVTVSNDETYLYVAYETTGDWYLTETHVYVGAESDIPLNNAGNPRIGHFYSEDHDSTQSYTYKFALENLDECFAIVTHAVVNKVVNGETVQDETAFGCGDKSFPGNRWGCYFDYCVSECEIGCAPAYAYHDGCGFCAFDNGNATYTNEIAYGSLAAWNYILIDLLANVDGCDLSEAIKIGYMRVAIVDEEAGILSVQPFVYQEYNVCEVSFFLDNDQNAAMNPGVNYFSFTYDPATSTPDTFEVTWPDTSKNIFIRGGVSITPAE